MDAVTYFKWNRAADLLSPVLFNSLGDGDQSSLTTVVSRSFQGSETIANWTPLGLAVNVAFKEGWINVWDGNQLLEGQNAQQHLYKHSDVTINFTDKGIADIAALLYGYDEGSEQ